MIVFKENSETARFSAKQMGGMEVGPSSAFPTLCVPGMVSLYKVSPQHSQNLSFTVRLDFFKATSTGHGGEVMNPNGFLTVHGVINDKDEVQINEHEGGVDKLNGRTNTSVLLNCLELAKSAVRAQVEADETTTASTTTRESIEQFVNTVREEADNTRLKSSDGTKFYMGKSVGMEYTVNLLEDWIQDHE